MIHFTKTITGAYRFETNTGDTFEVARNAGRGWSLFRVEFHEVVGSGTRSITTRIDGYYHDRREAAAAASWLGKTAEDFWTAVATQRLGA